MKTNNRPNGNRSQTRRERDLSATCSHFFSYRHGRKASKISADNYRRTFESRLTFMNGNSYFSRKFYASTARKRKYCITRKHVSAGSFQRNALNLHYNIARHDKKDSDRTLKRSRRKFRGELKIRFLSPSYTMAPFYILRNYCALCCRERMDMLKTETAR